MMPSAPKTPENGEKTEPASVTETPAAEFLDDFTQSVSPVPRMTVDGTDVQHPTLINAVLSMLSQGYDDERIARVTGMPLDIIRKHRTRVETRK
ncbi:MAG: hypothetical protein MN733_08825 [Nitrososphaera sp.]|nr:hypothetical protein [Nitrososphaera sp.]